MLYIYLPPLLLFSHLSLNHSNLFMLDAIGHVVEKNAVRETEKNGKKSKVLDITLEDLE